jgi:DNA-binding response OmpR family regulator
MKKILVVDDEVQITEFLKDYLEEHGYTADVADSGAAAIEKTVSYAPDLILLDIQMPKMSGLEALREIRKIAPQVKIIMLTGEKAPEIIESVARLGANHYMTKPIQLDELLKEMKRFF